MLKAKTTVFGVRAGRASLAVARVWGSSCRTPIIWFRWRARSAGLQIWSSVDKNKRVGRFRPTRVTTSETGLLRRDLLPQLCEIGFAANGQKTHLVGPVHRHADFHAAIRLVVHGEMADFSATHGQWECRPLVGRRVVTEDFVRRPKVAPHIVFG